MRHPSLRLCAALAAAVCSVPLPAGEWPQFRGPSGQGHAEVRGIPLTWSEQENVAWKTPLPGRGWSSPVVLGSQIWMTTALNEGRSLRALCVDRESGRLVHDIEVFRPQTTLEINPKNSHASPTPVVEPGRVYVHYGTLGTACLDSETGEVLWRNEELVLDHKEGPGSSPILYGGLLIVNCDGMDVRYVVALDKQTGKIVWKTNRSGPWHPRPDFNKAYSTPLVVKVAGRDQLVSVGALRTVAYDPLSGAELWWVEYFGFSNVPRPVFGHGMVYLCTGFLKPELWAVRVDGQGDVTSSHVAWRVTSQVPANPSPLLVGDELYIVSDGGVATCLDAKTGQQHWKERLGGNYSASPVLADGRIHFFAEDGTTAVLQPGKEFKVLATNRLDGQVQASPAFVGSEIYLRTDSHLYRIQAAPGGTH